LQKNTVRHVNNFMQVESSDFLSVKDSRAYELARGDDAPY